MFHRQSGALFVEGVRLSSLLSQAAQARGIDTPFFVYSREQLRRDFMRYAQAAESLDVDLGTPPLVAFAVKANPSRALLALLHGWGAGATVVSAGELALVRSVGIPGDKVLLHGNGKRQKDIDAALDIDALLSIDSEFDLQHVQARARALGRTARILLRVNPNIDPQVHPYISTGLLESKFGMAEASIERLRPTLRELARATDDLDRRRNQLGDRRRIGVHRHPFAGRRPRRDRGLANPTRYGGRRRFHAGFRHIDDRRRTNDRHDHGGADERRP